VHRALIGVALIVWLAPAASALANSDSMLTVGFGAGFGISTASEEPFGPVGEYKLRLRLLRVFGAELSYNPEAGFSPQPGLIYDSPVRLSGLLYIVPTSPVALYLKGGVGGTAVKTALNINSKETSYHAGAGLDVKFGGHLVIGSEFLLLAGGADTFPTLQGRGMIGATYRPSEPVVEHQFSIRNFRTVLTIMFYI
jgi:hypothetical protein